MNSPSFFILWKRSLEAVFANRHYGVFNDSNGKISCFKNLLLNYECLNSIF